MVEEFFTAGPAETRALGVKIGKSLKPRDIVLLTGELGAGKTTLIQGIAAGAGVSDYVTSPTFVIINEYKGQCPFYHIDLYRLENKDHLENLGLEDYFNSDGITVVEWAERLGKLSPKKHIGIKIERLSENEREILCEF